MERQPSRTGIKTGIIWSFPFCQNFRAHYKRIGTTSKHYNYHRQESNNRGNKNNKGN